MAACFAFMWICGFSMANLVQDDSSLQKVLLNLHIWIGVTLLFLLVARVVIWLTHRPPPLPDAISKFDAVPAYWIHALLYILPALAVTLGWANINLGGDDVTWFGLSMPKVFPTVESWTGFNGEELSQTLHMWVVYTILVLVVTHLLGVAKHRWIDKHDILRRMTL